MASRFDTITKEEIISINEACVKKKKNVIGNNVVLTALCRVNYLIFSTSYSKAKKENTIPCLRKLPSTKITMKTMKHLIFFSMVSTTRRISPKN